ncbi:MAG: 50S ribosomal protein L13 [Flavobacteriales bacterium]|nr:50S ribosomal protein L13 [Flavobacteriales bacterium]|tara:strand:- start:10246 stop:10707 length:462 start_codon:yes stop_codon:yes gene_type:complete
MKLSKSNDITRSVKIAEIKKSWLLVDASGVLLGRMASKVAKIIRGKHKPYYTPHLDCGDNVVVINAEKIKLSGDKMNSKEYISHTGYPGGRKSILAKDLIEKHPTRLVEKAVKGMLPKNRLGRSLYKNLYVYSGSEHNQEAQKPQLIKLEDIK